MPNTCGHNTLAGDAARIRPPQTRPEYARGQNMLAGVNGEVTER